jgi:glycosyltransferase involved in cell wall biosynthesis
MSPKYSIITTCKGRLSNLKITLPEFLKQENAEVVVVDFDCPDGTSDYVSQAYPAARVVSVVNKPRFNGSHAKNLGAAQSKGDFLVFLDADVVIAENFVRYVDSRIRAHSFARFGGIRQNSLMGSCVVGRKDFERIGGFDELLGGYEGEDLELYMRLRLIGAHQIMLEPTIVVKVVEQTTEERERYRAPDLKIQFLRGQLYSLAKETVISVLGTPALELDLRERLLKEVNRQLAPVYAGEQEFLLELNIPDKYKRGLLQEWEFSTSISIKARRKKQT